MIYQTNKKSNKMKTTTQKRITMATVKSFVKKNQGQIYVKVSSSFSGMTDCVESIEDDFTLSTPNENINQKYTLGLSGAWFVGNSRDYLQSYEDDKYLGFYVSNACGSFTIAIKKQIPEDKNPVQIDGVLIEWHEGNGEFEGKTYNDLELLQTDLKQIYIDFVSGEFYTSGTYNKTKLCVLLSKGKDYDSFSFRLDIGTNKGDFNPFQHQVKDAILEFYNSLNK